MSNESRIEKLLETGQISAHDADLMREKAPRVAATREGKVVLTASGVRPPRRRYSRRGGRAYPEPSDSELDPNWNVPYEPVDAEEAARRREQAEEDHLVRLREKLRQAVSLDEWRRLLVDERARRERAGLQYTPEIYREITEGLEEPTPDTLWNIQPR